MHRGLCTESINNLHAVSAGFRALRWCDTGSHRKWPDTHTCFLSTKITLRWAQWEFCADQPAALCLMRTNRVCAGRVGALFFLSETGMNNSRACHNTPEWCFISSQHCHKVNTSSAIALCFLTCLAAHSDVPCPLVLCPTPFSESAPHSALISHFLVGLSRACRETTAWCEVRCYLSQPSVRGVDIRTGVLLCHCNWLSLSFRGHQ